MEVRFRTTALQRCYEDERRASRRWGAVVGQRFIQRITILRAASSFGDLFQLRSLGLHALKGDREGQFSLTIHGRSRLTVTYDEDEDVLIVEEVTAHYGD